MKKLILALAAALMLPMCTGCNREDDEPLSQQPAAKDSMQQMTIRFEFPMAVSMQPMTRATLADAQLTDLWLFDYMNGSLVNTIHQTSDDVNFGAIALNADYGDHNLYFVASRGTTPTVSGTSITWAKPSDTFWHSMSLTVAPGMSATQSVTLSRVVTRLRISVTDEVPATLAKLSITPDHWYCGLDYTTGEPTADTQQARTVEVPSSYIGTIGQLSMSIYGLCSATEYTTDITVSALASDESTIASLTLSDVPLRRNRITSYTGQLFGHANAVSVSVGDDWDDEHAVNW